MKAEGNGIDTATSWKITERGESGGAKGGRSMWSRQSIQYFIFSLMCVMRKVFVVLVYPVFIIIANGTQHYNIL